MMPNKITIIKYNEELTNAAKNIFGDTVEKVFVTTWNFDDSFEDEYEEILERIKSDENRFEIKNDSLFLDAIEIWIKFNNGNTISINNSEWCILKKVNNKKFHELK